MSPDPSSKPAGSDLSYTVDYDEPSSASIPGSAEGTLAAVRILQALPLPPYGFREDRATPARAAI
ncbi:Hypothetical protein PFREUD_22810 [Propionibacterium freudenreichii subsp. shermanii CIRM-BIA1]|uniref:Uncharacterized protein n=1 Tax=Propionibacterium freudenreichii subsp. shermanii (strain ATCC 9614 / DSM 4902 / CIP 103027 / NCIMB 8099 / CIRM-BIA1) TaxID=754252 RepID=D7GGX9_PROFC|nr:Hypothetical protein PFREUD_22810 [Propionibacterium freudenreichii subsp. shermanii CIRM-BIA1]